MPPSIKKTFHPQWTSIKARKSTHCLVRGKTFYPSIYSIGRMLTFMQSGLDQHLALTSRSKSGLVIFFQSPLLAYHSLMKTLFVQGVSHVAPPVQPPITLEDLNLVLWTLQKLPFEPSRDSPISTLSCKVSGLIQKNF